MSDYLKEVLIRRTNKENQQYRPEQPSKGGIQDVNGNSIESPFEQSIIENPQFNGDPRIGTQQEIEKAGFKVKEGAIPEKGINPNDLDSLKIKYSRLEDSEENNKAYEAEKEALYVDYYNGTQIESDKNEFIPYINEFKNPLSEKQEKQIAQLEKMAESIGVEIRHFGTKKISAIDYQTNLYLLHHQHKKNH